MSNAASALGRPGFDDGGWLDPLHDWPTTALRSLQSAGMVARIVVASVRGSAPREAGTCMLVEPNRAFGTIGGGHLEWKAIEAARNLLQCNDPRAATVQRFVLATDLAQCCGGVVELWIEKYTRTDSPLLAETARASKSTTAALVSEIHDAGVSRRIVRPLKSSMEIGPSMTEKTLLEHCADGTIRLSERLGQRLPHVWLFGAGHVGQALTRVFADLPVHLRWIDSRPSLLPLTSGDRLDVVCTDDPAATVASAPARTHFIVMTHSHSLDYDLCRAILDRGDAAWVGLIGSKSKAARFRSRLAGDGLTEASIATLTSPIGVDGIDSKIPGVIAVSVAAQLLQVFDGATEPPASVATATTGHCDGDCSSCAGKAS